MKIVTRIFVVAALFIATAAVAATWTPSLKADNGVPISVPSSRTQFTPGALTLGLPNSVAPTNYAYCTNAAIAVYPGQDIRVELFGGTAIFGTNTLGAVTNGVFGANYSTSSDGITFRDSKGWLVFTPTSTVTNQRVSAILYSTNIYPCKAVKLLGITNLTSRTLYPTNVNAFFWMK